MSAEESLHTQLQNLISSNQWERAKNVLYELLAKQPESSWLHQSMGMVLYHLEDYKNAEAHLKTAIAHDPSYSEAYTQLAHVYLGLQRLGTADDTIKTALSLDVADPENWVISFHIALAYSDLDRAKLCYSKLEQMIPEGATLLDLKTRLLSHPHNKEKIDYKAQIEAHKKILAEDPEYDLAHYHLAELHLSYSKQYDLAEEHIRVALKSDPTDKDYQKILMKIVRKKNRWLKLLSSPSQFMTDINDKDKEESLSIWVLVGVFILIFLIGNSHPELVNILIFAIIAMFVCSYTVCKLYEYMTLSEVYHEMGKVVYFSGPLSKIHRLPYKHRFIIFTILTIVSWAIFALVIYFFTK